MSCRFILKKFSNCNDKRRTASSVNHYTWNKYIFHTEPSIFLSNNYNTFGDNIFWIFGIMNVICPRVQNNNIFLTFDLFNVDWLYWKSFNVVPPTIWHSRFAVISRVFKLQIFILILLYCINLFLVFLLVYLFSLTVNFLITTFRLLTVTCLPLSSSLSKEIRGVCL